MARGQDLSRGGAGALAGEALGLSGLQAVGLGSAISGFSAGGSTYSLNAVTGNPSPMDNVGYVTAIGALAPLGSGEAMAIGGAGISADSTILNAGTNIFAVGLGP